MDRSEGRGQVCSPCALRGRADLLRPCGRALRLGSHRGRGYSARDDRLEGGEGADLLFGAEGNDSLFGGGGNDEIYGGDDDIIQGEGGDDYLVSADDGEVFGADDVQGGSGNDTCIVDEDDAVSNCEDVIVR